MQTDARYIGIADAAAYLGLSKSRLYKLAAPACAAIPTYKVGGSIRFDREELDRWMASKRRPTADEQENAVLARLRAKDI